MTVWGQYKNNSNKGGAVTVLDAGHVHTPPHRSQTRSRKREFAPPSAAAEAAVVEVALFTAKSSIFLSRDIPPPPPPPPRNHEVEKEEQEEGHHTAEGECSVTVAVWSVGGGSGNGTDAFFPRSPFPFNQTPEG